MPSDFILGAKFNFYHFNSSLSEQEKSFYVF